ncbi:MAG: hypothetical protein J1F35_05560 [Erysipelotrichales bacterium]|nr:hypothetical protein [Erysipelotrichales bacterium]
MLIGDGFNLTEFCSSTKEILTFIGWALTIVKVAIPFIIIAYGILDLGKAVTASKDEEIKTAAKRLLFRAIAGICIFFVPAIVLWLFRTVSEFNQATAGGGFTTCENALLRPWGTGNDGTGDN